MSYIIERKKRKLVRNDLGLFGVRFICCSDGGCALVFYMAVRTDVFRI